MKKLSLSAVALIGLTAAAAPAFAADAHHARHHHHHGKKCNMKHGQKKEDGKAPQATEDLNASSLQKSQPAAPALEATPAQPAAPAPEAAPAN
ncbi:MULTISPECIES: hypothetical protein [Acetobacteraceae]|uniref:Pentapeptide MXKDX repeat protein n=1 Tax=Bombella apis TaxID=1785988 RepID=A0ABR9MMT6_9PROT|nr:MULTISPECIES: hypothetical protein [Acetobacteraceae]MCL1561886.1 hypothetical protein [Parasaccharibacter sp. TMW 2.1886]MBE1723146.1 hypothetical protein [Bombella apis]MBR9730953.1 hypothetical protein [Bombella apis]MCT6819196.1 hypothetical protein [Bombella apis]MCT6844779.1 hypothetical protein [Bombella apis]